MNKLAAGGLLAVLVVSVGLYLFLRKVPEVPERPEVPEARYSFSPAGCGFMVSLAGEPKVESKMRGELTITTATLKPSPQASVRVSCGPYLVRDRQAFRAHLPKQISFAARAAGVKDAQESVREEDGALIASFEGLRGEGDGARFIRSETRVRGDRFVEILYLVSPGLASDAQLARLARLEDG